MAAFKYRLKQVYNLRERKKKEQEQRVAEAQAKVRQIELKVEEKKQEIRSVRQSMLVIHHTLMTATDRFLEKLDQDMVFLLEDLRDANKELEFQRTLLIKAQADLEALVKHREKMYEEWQEEEKKREMKQLDEVAGQRYFRAQQVQMQEEMEWETMMSELANEEELEEEEQENVDKANG